MLKKHVNFGRIKKARKIFDVVQNGGETEDAIAEGCVCLSLRKVPVLPCLLSPKAHHCSSIKWDYPLLRQFYTMCLAGND